MLSHRGAVLAILALARGRGSDTIWTSKTRGACVIVQFRFLRPALEADKQERRAEMVGVIETKEIEAMMGRRRQANRSSTVEGLGVSNRPE